MKKAFNRIFWGYLFVLVDFHLNIIDILADPIGYCLIFSGLTILHKNFLTAHKAKKLSLALIFISIPSTFIQQNGGTSQLSQLSFFSGWSLYMNVLSLLNLILVFFIFQLIMEIVHKHGDARLIKRSSRTFTTYMIAMLITAACNAFIINLSGDILVGIGIFNIVIYFIMEVVFLILLMSLRKLNYEND